MGCPVLSRARRTAPLPYVLLLMCMASTLLVCGAVRGNGTTCKLRCKPGYSKCYLHGAATPTAKIKAEHYIALLRVPAIESLHLSLESLNQLVEQFISDPCAACGFPKGSLEEKEALVKTCLVSAKTVATILDRTGIGPRATLEVMQGDGDLDLRMLSAEHRAKMIGLLAQLRELKAEIRQQQLAAVNAPLTVTTAPTIM